MESRTAAPQYQRLADKLRAQIMSGELSAGQRLPAEPELMKQYGVSRSTWREALRTLAAENLVVATRGVTGGTFVVEPSTGDVEEYLRKSLSMLMRSQLSAEQILEARYFLEVPAAGVAAERRTEEQLQILRQSIEDLRADAESTNWRANNQFHNALLDATENPLLRALISPITATLRASVLREHAQPEFWAEVACDHEAILVAIEAQDRSAAEAAMRTHLANLRVTYTELGKSAAGTSA
ncbi:FadR/GntR family transcriptional regulator [Kribbella lupini]|uniref:FadR/GntR family transcriptional regulator n=1 Tax=Kribbella lupini TaxID=291602 RepID=A0ABP4NIM8_9ACTN